MAKDRSPAQKLADLRWKGTTQEERTAAASKAAKARWAKNKKGKRAA